jgi:hypothetical protein
MQFYGLCKNASELTDGQISKLVGSTKGTVSLIRKKSYWNFSNLKTRDPVILALCYSRSFQKSLDKAKRRVEREKKAKIREKKRLKLLLSRQKDFLMLTTIKLTGGFY